MNTLINLRQFFSHFVSILSSFFRLFGEPFAVVVCQNGREMGQCEIPHAIRGAFHYNFPGFACWGDLILSEYQNQFCACSAQPRQKCELGSLFNTQTPAALRVRDCALVGDTYTMF